MGPQGRALARVARLNREVNDIMRLPDVNKQLAVVSAQAVFGTPDGLRRAIADEAAKWRALMTLK